VKQQHTATEASILTTKSTYRSLHFFLLTALSGLFDTDAYGHIVSLPLTEFISSSPEALHTKQTWALSASEGANYILRNLASKSVIFGRTRFLLHASKLGDGTDYFTSPPKEGMLWIFPTGKKSDGFGRERTRDLGYQRPPCKPLDHRSRIYRSLSAQRFSERTIVIHEIGSRSVIITPLKETKHWRVYFARFFILQRKIEHNVYGQNAFSFVCQYFPCK
jgi:hypothetical protein